MIHYPYVTAILAITLDGKITSGVNNPARFSSSTDLAHLETQISLCDAIVFGANTLRAYGTSLTIKNPQLLQQRKNESKSPQPLNIVCSPSGNLDPHWRFFTQPLPRALLTTKSGKKNWLKKFDDLNWQSPRNDFFEQYYIVTEQIKWADILSKLKLLDYKKIAILGGATLISSLLKENLIDDIWLTICPLIMGKESAPSFIESSWLKGIETPINLKLLEVKAIGQEIFVHYLIKQKN